jgi:CzcA family heavy metal efflux pump
VTLGRFALSHTKSILFVTLLLSAVGVWVLGSFPVGIIPDVTFPRLVVIAEAGQRPAQMMVVQVTRPLEEAISTVPGVAHVRSKTERGATELTIDFGWGSDMVTALQLVEAKINETRPQLPADADVRAERMNPTVFPVLGLSLRDRHLSQSELWTLATYTIKPLLTEVPGVAQVVVQGGRVPEIAVDVKPERLTAYGISLADIEDALAKANVICGAGLMDRQFRQYQIVVSGQVTDPEGIGNATVAQHDGVPLHLFQVADIHPSLEDRTTIVTADGVESVLVNIVRQPNANTVSVVNGVRRQLAEAKSTLPPGLGIRTFYDQSALIHEAVGSVRDAVLMGLALAVLVVLIFLGNLRTTFVTVVTIPATLLITFLLLRVAGLTLNIMTLGAIAVGLGLVIDDSIVVVENIYRIQSTGERADLAVERATADIAKPMLASTLTTIVVFLPLVLLTGVAGAFFAALAVTLVIVLAVSLAIAMLVVPSIAGAMVRRQPQKAVHRASMDRLVRGYDRIVRLCMRHRSVVLAAAAAIPGLTILVAGRLGTGFMPTMDEGAFVLDYLTPPGTSLVESDRILRKIEDILRQTPEVAAYSRRTGTELGFAVTEPNSGDFAVTLKRRRSERIEQIMDRLRNRISKEVPGVQIDFIQVLQDLIGDLAGAPSPVEVKIFGPQQAELNGLAGKVAAEVEKIPGAVDVATSVVESGPQIVIHADPTKAGRIGLTADDIASQVNAAMFGDVATQVLQGARQIGVRVRYPKDARTDLLALEAMPVRTPAGRVVPLSSVGTIELVSGTTELSREDQRPLVRVKAHLAGRDLGSVMHDVQSVMRGIALPPGVSYTFGGQYQSQGESFRMLLVVLTLAIMLVFSVILFQFGSFTVPSAILMVMPLSFFGVAVGLWVTGTPLNVSSFMGAIMLIGIIGENSILFFYHLHGAEKGGVNLEDAVVHAGQTRLRPILMTAVTTILALLPLSLGLGAGAELQKPLAIAVIGGLTLSTVFTLIIAPVLYVTVRRRRSRRKPLGGDPLPHSPEGDGA